MFIRKMQLRQGSCSWVSCGAQIFSPAERRAAISEHRLWGTWRVITQRQGPGAGSLETPGKHSQLGYSNSLSPPVLGTLSPPTLLVPHMPGMGICALVPGTGCRESGQELRGNLVMLLAWWGHAHQEPSCRSSSQMGTDGSWGCLMGSPYLSVP